MATSLGSIIWYGKSGQGYSFQIYLNTDNVPEKGGIYIFTKRDESTKRHTAIYIGKAKSFDSRFYDHHKEDCIKKHGANRLCLMEEKDDKKRTQIENDLLANYNTSCNEVKN